MSNTNILCCQKCGSEEILEPHFVNPNTSIIKHTCNDISPLCESCKELTTLINKSEFKIDPSTLSLLEDWQKTYSNYENMQLSESDKYDLLDELIGRHPYLDEDDILDFLDEHVITIL